MKRYKIIYADPPWVQDSESSNLHVRGSARKKLPYEMMTVENIAALNVRDIAEKDSVLFLWTTNRHIEDAYRVARAWGFKPSTMLVWCKKPKGRGLGGTFGMSAEYLLFCRRGTCRASGRHNSTWFEAKRRKHSQKPEEAREIIEKSFEGSKIELFAREKFEGWDSWGNEIISDIDL